MFPGTQKINIIGKSNIRVQETCFPHKRNMAVLVGSFSDAERQYSGEEHML
jgi:hypothetical protein